MRSTNQTLALTVFLSLFLSLFALAGEAIGQDQEKHQKYPSKTTEKVAPQPEPTPTPKANVDHGCKHATKPAPCGEDKASVPEKVKPSVAEKVVVTEMDKCSCQQNIYGRHEKRKVWRNYYNRRFKIRGKNIVRKLTFEENSAKTNKRVLKQKSLLSKDISLTVPSDAQLAYNTEDSAHTITLTPIVNSTEVPLIIRAMVDNSKVVSAKWESRSLYKLQLDPKSVGTTKLIVWVPGTNLKEVRTITITDPAPASTSLNVQITPPSVTITTPDPTTSATATPTSVGDANATTQTTATVNETTTSPNAKADTPASVYSWLWLITLGFIILVSIASVFLLRREYTLLGIAGLVVAFIMALLLFGRFLPL